MPGWLNLFIFPLNLIVLLLPGFAVAARVLSKRELRETYLITLILITSGTLGYVSFWAFFASKPLGKFFSFAVVATALISLVFDLARSKDVRAAVRGVLPPFCYLVVVGVFYLCCFYLFSNPAATGAGLSQYRFFEQPRPGDQVIPFIFAERIYSHEPLKPFMGDWLSSDRPPLQAGLSLFEHPLRIFGDAGLNYELLGTGLQLFWICGVWVLLVSLDAPKARIKQVLVLLVFSGFLLFNTTYPWPKLLAATFILLAVGIFFEVLGENRAFTRFETTLAAASVSLAMMAHPGSVFSLPAFGVVLICKRKILPPREWVLGCAIVAIFALPWIAYQKLYDPPGNRLLKMHLGGQIAVDNRGVWQTIRENYAREGFRTTVLNKWANIKCLVGPAPLDAFGLSQEWTRINANIVNREVAEEIRINQREYIWDALGVLNLGWIAGLWLTVRRRAPALPHATLLVIAALVNLLVWALVLFGVPNATVTTHSSYADIFFLCIGLCGFLLTLPRFVFLAVFAVQILNFILVWVCSPPFTLGPARGVLISPSLQMPELLVGLGVGAGLVWHFGIKAYEARLRRRL